MLGREVPVLANWVQFHAETGDWDVKVVRDERSLDSKAESRLTYRFEIQGPKALDLLNDLNEGGPLTTKFFNMGEITIAGCKARTLSHGMGGAQGLEIWGPASDSDTVRAALARFRHRRHDLMLMQVLDRQELRFDLDEPMPFEGLEGEGRLNVDPRVVREDYLEALTRHCDELERSARSLGFDYLRLDTHGSVGPAIAALLGRRATLARGGRAG